MCEASTPTARRWASTRFAATCPPTSARPTLDETIDELNANPECTGYIVQLPLPKHLNENAALERLDPGKDADGLHPMNLGRLVLDEPAPLPCTPRGIVHLLRRYEVEIAGAQVAVIGRGVTVGRPLGLLLTRRSENATVTLCHTATRHLPELTRRPTSSIAAAGVPHMVSAEMVKPGAAVVDVGVSRDENGKLVGDVAPGRVGGGGSRLAEPGRRRAADACVPVGQRRRTGREGAVTPKEFARKVFRGQWPILLVGLFFVAAFGLVIAGYWRRGALRPRYRRGGRGRAAACAHRRPGGPARGAQQGHRPVHHCDGQCGRAVHRRDDRPVGHELDFLPVRQSCPPCKFLYSGGMTGLRERKKLDTRRALSDAALKLAFDQGLENVTREAIADLAGVSLRTFNNYFTGKYEALAYRQTERLRRSISVLRQRPADEPLWTSITESVIAPLDEDFREATGEENKLPTRTELAEVRKLLMRPEIRDAANKELFDEWLDAIAERTGTDPERDIYPRLVAAVVRAVGDAATEIYVRAEPPVAITTLIRAGFAEVAAGMPEPANAERGKR